jgi:leucyl-tRNA synthetase
MSQEEVKELGAALESKAAVSDNNAHRRWSLMDDSTIDYGYLSKTGGAGIQQSDSGFYLTTAINYTNGPAHMGHAYEAATSDVICRFQRLKGEQPCYFVTGADEHGQKIANTAESEGKEPQDICDKVSLWRIQMCRRDMGY